MNISIGKCGCSCADCPTYKLNLKTIGGRKKCSAGWEKYLGIKLSPQKLRACDGCSIPDSKRKTYYLNCKIRKCAIINEVENCAYCTAFPCNELLNAHSLQNISSRNEYIKKTGKEISAGDYRNFIEPYTGLFRLKKIRTALSEKDLKEYKKFSTKDDFAPSAEKQEQLKILYSILTALFAEHNVSYAKLQTLEKKREQIMKILWTIGFYGVFKKDSLELDAKTFLSQKITGMYNYLREYFKELENSGIHCEIIPLIDKGWLTPMGGLRKEGWFIKFAFGENLKGVKTLNLFKNYIQKLDKKYGKQGFRHFNNADLSIMTD